MINVDVSVPVSGKKKTAGEAQLRAVRKIPYFGFRNPKPPICFFSSTPSLTLVNSYMDPAKNIFCVSSYIMSSRHHSYTA